MKKKTKKVTKRRAKPAARAKANAKKTKPKAKAPARKAARSSPRPAPAVPASSAFEPAIGYKTRAAEDPTLPDTPNMDEDSGDLEGLSRHEISDSESVEELVDEGQDLEAEEIEGIEEAPDPDQGEVKARGPRRRPVPQFKDRDRL